MPFWRNRDRERFIGSYDPEHEMPNPDRRPNERYQSDAYRRSASDSRFAYRWNPDRFEGRFEGRHRDEVPYDRDWNRDARDRFYEDRFAQTRMGREGRRDYGGMSAPRSYERGPQFDRGWDYDRNRGRDMSSSDRDSAGYARDRDSAGYRGGRDFGSYGRGGDYRASYGPDYGSDRPDDRGYDRGYDRDYDRSYDRDRNAGRSMPDWDREERTAHDRDYGWEDVGDIPYDRNRNRRY